MGGLLPLHLHFAHVYFLLHIHIMTYGYIKNTKIIAFCLTFSHDKNQPMLLLVGTLFVQSFITRVFRKSSMLSQEEIATFATHTLLDKHIHQRWNSARTRRRHDAFALPRRNFIG